MINDVLKENFFEKRDVDDRILCMFLQSILVAKGVPNLFLLSRVKAQFPFISKFYDV